MSILIDGSNSVTINSGAILGITSGTAVASTSGTSIDFTSLPSWVKRITVMFAGVSTSGSSVTQIQLGTGSTSYTTSGYVGGGWYANTTNLNVTTGIALEASGSGAGARTANGIMTISNMGSNTWAASATIWDSSSTGSGCLSAAYVSLAAALTAVRITTVNGTDTFDAGTINILYE